MVFHASIIDAEVLYKKWVGNMMISNFGKLCKAATTTSAIFLLLACGGESTRDAQNDNSASEAGVTYTSSLTMPNESTDFPLYTDSGLIADLKNFPINPQQELQAQAKQQLFEQAANTNKSVAGFIVKYKSSSASSIAVNNETLLGLKPTQNQINNQVIGLSTNNRISALAVNSLNSVATKHGVQLNYRTQAFNGAAIFNADQVLTLNQAKSIANEMKAANTDIESIEPNIIMQASSIPTNEEISALWGLKTASTYGVNAQQAWGTSDGTGVVVAVVDTGYRPHVDLAGKFVTNSGVLAGYDFIGDTSVSADGNGRDSDAIDPGDNCSGDGNSWHGTHVSGTIAAAGNGIGVAGVAYGAKILPVRVLGKCGGYLSDVADGIVWAAGGNVAGVPANPNPAKVINLSLGGGSSTCDTTMKNAIDTARSLGAVVVVAAGNSATDAKFSTPANCSAAITVGATDINGLLASFSNYGSFVDISAPGVNIKSTINSGVLNVGADNVYANYSGTSMATPHVAGVLALMFAKEPSLTVSAAESKLILNTRVFSPYFGSSKTAGAGIADAYKALLSLSSTPPPGPTPPTPPNPKPIRLKSSTATDFNADNIADELWRNVKTGLTRITFIGQNSISSSNITFSLLKGTTYKLQASGDFNGDGKKDLILRHSKNGKAVVALMQGATVSAQGLITNVPLTYTAVASGDFNKDGNDDILWRNTKGTMFISYMNGVKELSRSSYINIASSIKLQGVADFDGDGYDDLLLRAANGYVYTLLMSDTGAYWVAVALASSNYQIVGLGDYSGDGINDILFRNSRDGKLTLFASPINEIPVMYNSASTIASFQNILKSGDFDGDGKADLLLRNSKNGVITRVVLGISGANLNLSYSSSLGVVQNSFTAQ